MKMFWNIKSGKKIRLMNKAKEMFGENFIGPEELQYKQEYICFSRNPTIEPLPELNILSSYKSTHLLVYKNPILEDGRKISLSLLLELFGNDPGKIEPCFYNQDWYLNERFFRKTLEPGWILISENLADTTRGIHPSSLSDCTLPSALDCAYVFFMNFLINHKVLWQFDYVWCNDNDSNGDQIYVGRYFDPLGMNKRGFSIHRHLKIKPNYGSVNFQIIAREKH